MNLILENEVVRHINVHGEEAYPDECCGFFFGRENERERRVVTHALRVPNVREGDRRRRFRISAGDYCKAEQYAADKNLDLLGVYHSHPDHPAVPSEHDRKVAMPFFSYVIVSVLDGKAAGIRSWRLNEQRRFEEESVQTVKLEKQQSI